MDIISAVSVNAKVIIVFLCTTVLWMIFSLSSYNIRLRLIFISISATGLWFWHFLLWNRVRADRAWGTQWHTPIQNWKKYPPPPQEYFIINWPSSNNLVLLLMNTSRELYSSLSRLSQQTFSMLTEVPKMVSIFNISCKLLQ